MVEREPHSTASPSSVVAALDRLRARAMETRSTAFVAERGGAVVAQAGDVDRQVEIMSITTAVVSLVVGQLVDRGLLALDTSVAEYVPSWRDTPKERIRVVHLVEHTSGLADKPTTEDIYAASDFVASAEAAELE